MRTLWSILDQQITKLIPLKLLANLPSCYLLIQVECTIRLRWEQEYAKALKRAEITHHQWVETENERRKSWTKDSDIGAFAVEILSGNQLQANRTCCTCTEIGLF